MACPESKTQDGFERQFGVNHLAHHFLTKLLLPTLIASSTADHKSRVVNLSSTGHRFGKVQWDDYNFEKPNTYDGMLAYAQSKTANLWTANYIDRHYGPKGVHAYSVHPGGVWSGLQQFAPPELQKYYQEDPEWKPIWQTPEQGAASTVWAAVASVLEGNGGQYISETGVADVVETAEFQPLPHAAPWAFEPESEDRLWELSERLVGDKGL
jgi:NAD(P)-dependent dehydrogenase (short-subunit alcohol dehydrogenase family)